MTTKPKSIALNRREFLGVSLIGAAAQLIGCRKPVEHIVPYVDRPEEMIPGRPTYYASSLWTGNSVLGVLVESHEGRPTKIEGNPQHPMSNGVTNHYAQAEIRGLYDNKRAQSPTKQGQEQSWEEAWSAFDTAFNEPNSQRGILVNGRPSPSLDGWLKRLVDRQPEIRLFKHDPVFSFGRAQAFDVLGIDGAKMAYRLDKTDFLITLDCDLFGTEPDATANAHRYFTANSQKRHYAVDPHFTVTSASADHRLILPASTVGDLLIALAQVLFARIEVPNDEYSAVISFIQERQTREYNSWITEVVDALLENRQKSLIAIGDRQPTWVHVLGLVLNRLLGNLSETILFHPNEDENVYERINDFVVSSLSTLLIIGGNPAYNAQVDLNVANVIGQIRTSFHISTHFNQTSEACTWHFPETHPLETWLDLQANDGTISIQQPLIEPLFNGVQVLEVVARLIPEETERSWNAARLIREHWRRRQGIAGLHQRWRRWLQNGVVEDRCDLLATIPEISLENLITFFATTEISIPNMPNSHSLEVVFTKDHSLFDGRYANNDWLQELPDPITKITWDNAAIIGPATADALNIRFTQSGWPDRTTEVERTGKDRCDLINITIAEKTLQIAAWVCPGVAEGVVILPIGYGTTYGSVSINTHEEFGGFNVFTLFQSDDSDKPILERIPSWIQTGANITKTGETYFIATTQDHWNRENRPLFGTSHSLAEEHHSLWDEPNEQSGQQWGMSINLDACIGCNVCTIACQAENSIPSVGKREVLNGRVMHWIRVDRYFDGDSAEPRMKVQPIACMHCENAPCEQVCPVSATTHGDEGTNDMVYNRCIGTRYCANNCPYKVRRFNFFNYTRREDEQNPYLSLQRNPNVTVRFRGVIEKCTYCIQRINAANIAVKTDQTLSNIPDGKLVVACEQACPTNAIIFGNINDPHSRVSRQKAKEQNYLLLEELHTQPRTSYLG